MYTSIGIQTSFTDWSGNESLQHYGVQGMKWGVRKYQNPDGSLTSAGKARYSRSPEGLGFTPLKGKRGDVVQRRLGKNTISAEKKAAKLTEKARKMKESDGGVESETYKKTIAKAKTWAQSAEIARSMQKTYANMAMSDQKKIRSGYHVVRNYILAGGGAIGGAIAGGFKGRSDVMLTQRAATERGQSFQDYYKKNRKALNRALA